MVEMASAYALALYESAKDNGLEKEIFDELTSFHSLIEEMPKLQAYLSHPQIKLGDKKKTLENIFEGQIQPIFLRFLCICIEHAKIQSVDAIYEAYKQIVREANNVELVKVESATTLSHEQQVSLQKVLEKQLGKKVEMQIKVVPELLAGLRVHTADRILDNTLYSQIETMREQLKRAG